ncbi:N(6)-adenine-specific methyltransferase METTL4 isoform X1 [Ictalurus furcatus]|uniref:N(6)-adenine-specific methyltransferase METTL4 isoform X1 n=1 Tax=Ictalurus furcatus TaxID=66913 RepID=UPI002350D898|nr:N(6)-adenine-specific methyltransferase METTL4 isoform X1 [Ictalurus furcatus]
MFTFLSNRDLEMSVLLSNERGWLLDACSFINEGFRRCYSLNKGYFRCCFKKQYFDILKPHIVSKSRSACMMGAVPNTESHAAEDNKIELKTRKKRKRKRSEMNQGELDAEVYHKKVRWLVLEGTRSLLETGHHCGYLTEDLHTVPAKQMPGHECQMAALCDMAKQLPKMENSDAPHVQAVNGHPDMDAHLDLFSCLTENPDDIAREVTLMGETYFLPPRSRFLLSDITRLQPLIRSEDKYDLIVLDPPWENKSVKRSSRYSFLPSSQLKQLPVPVLSAAGCVVVIWVTNRPRHLRFVKEELYPHWGVKLLAEWLWVKVTRKGEVVFPLDSPHKKPYEVLLLGRFSANSYSTTGAEACEIPDQRLIISIPSALHSQKPALSAVLKPYIRSNAKCLEMFARSLQTDWTSWGNEVLKFQHHSYFTTDSVECARDTFTETTDADQQVDTRVMDKSACL